MKKPTLLEVSEWVLALVVTVAFLAGLKKVWAFITVPYQINFAEGVILSGIQRVMHGQSLYPAARAFPLVIHQYGPICYYVGAWALKLAGFSFAPLRFMTLVSGVLIAVLVALLVEHFTESWLRGLTFGGLFLTLPYVQTWFPVARVDLAGIALTLAGVYLYVRYPHRWLFSIPFFVAALYCKYTLVAGPGACFLDLLGQKRYKHAAGFAGSLALLFAASFWFFQKTTGPAFTYDTITSHTDPFSMGSALYTFMITVLHVPVLCMLALGAVLMDAQKRVVTLPSLYLVLSTLTLVTTGKLGSDTNHVLEWTAVLCLCGGMCFAALARQSAEAAAFLLAPMLVISVAITILPPLVYSGRSGCPEAYAYVKHHTGSRILSEDVGAVVLAGKPVQLSDPFVWTWLVKRGGWSDAEMQSLIRTHFFDAILLDGPVSFQRQLGANSHWPVSVLDAIEQDYHPVKEFACQDAEIAYEPAVARP